MSLHYSSALCLAGEQLMNAGQGPSSGMSEQYNRGPPGPIGNMQLGHRQQYGPFGPGYERRYKLLAELRKDTFAVCSLHLTLIQKRYDMMMNMIKKKDHCTSLMMLHFLKTNTYFLKLLDARYLTLTLALAFILILFLKTHTTVTCKKKNMYICS